MIKQKLINFVKTHGWFYDLYYFIGSTLLRIIGKVIKIKEKSILFVSFGGKKFDDSPKAIYDYICNNQMFDEYELIWAFNEPEKYNLKRGKKIKIDTFKYYLIALGSKFWITNSAIERGLNFKNKKTFYINTWHGTPLKKIGTDAVSTSSQTGLGSKNIYTQNLMTAQSEFDANIFSRLFGIDKNNILICDLPRNDYFSNNNNYNTAEIKEKLGIRGNRKIVLYAPTYREYLRDEENNNYIAPPIDINKWKEKLDEDYIILFRAHYEIINVLGIENSSFIYNVSNYENLNELMIVSDMLISDYSSIFFDYSILGKPMYCFAYDLEEYKNKRGLYLDIKKELPFNVAINEDELINQIINLDYNRAIQQVLKFKKKYLPNTGYACHTVVEEIVKRSI
ncbi:CDP-glycerol glycerophosphotransferase family protein [Bacillaceae bacterium C204]|uniref:CDP-glycerol glycerophosphotransferase family protein n=1 Tax=Neobacillus sp. 204 TaxID=3383351 RepID=UPI00397E8282